MKARLYRFALPLSLLLALVLAVFPLSTVFASADTQTITDSGTYTFTDVVPCGASVPYAITSDFNNVAHFTELSNGMEHMTFTEEGQVVAVPTVSGNPTYSGHYTIWDGENTNQQNANMTFTFSVHLTGSDGSTVSYNEVAHFSVSATGIVVAFDKPTCH